MYSPSTLPIDILNQYPELHDPETEALLSAEIRKNPMKIVVLDDDPTGVQTVHDISVFTHWDRDTIQEGFAEKNKLFYILTNSRGMTVQETTDVHTQIAQSVASVSEQTKIPYLLISRSDSTLRGHYPLETDLLRRVTQKCAGTTTDGEILCPFFPEGGRYTIGNVHYVKIGQELIPAGETEFAKDRTFFYHASDLRDYIEEKTGGACKAEDVICISLESLRAKDFDGIEAQLMQAQAQVDSAPGAADGKAAQSDGAACSSPSRIIVNAVTYSDLKVFAVALYRAMAKGKRYIFRSAAALVKVLGGISDQPLLTRTQMIRQDADATRGGIIVVGSHTQKTTQQLERLLTLEKVKGIEFNSDLVLDGEDAFHDEIERVVAESAELIRQGITPVCYTKRTLLTLENDTPEEALIRSVRISDGVQSLVGQLPVCPAFVMAKGGITSSDIGTKALKVRKANVLGQIQPGIPVWETGAESRFPGIPYVIFPGNTGDEDTLRKAADILITRK